MSAIEAVNRIKAMKPGSQFFVKSSKDRARLLNTAKMLRNAGVIEFQLMTRKTEDGVFVIVASAV